MNKNFNIGKEIFYEIEQLPDIKENLENEELLEYLNISEEEYEEITYNLAAKKIAYDIYDFLNDEGNIKEEDYEEAILNYKSNISDLRRFYKWGVLGQALKAYFVSYTEMLEKLDIYEMNGYFYFEVGGGYEINDVHLLNGDGSGEETKAFLNFINE